MASGKSLDESLHSDVDSTINAIVGALDTNLVTTSIENTSQYQQQINDNSNNLSSNLNRNNISAISVTNIDSNPTLSSSTIQKHSNNNNNNNNTTTSISDPITDNVFVNNNNNASNNNNLQKDNINNNDQCESTSSIYSNKFNVNKNINSVLTSDYQSSNNLAADNSNRVESSAATISSSEHSNELQFEQQKQQQQTTLASSPATVTSQYQQQKVVSPAPGTTPTSIVTPQQHYQNTQHFGLSTNVSNSLNMSKNNEPVKLVYPTSVGSSQPAVLNMNNRVTFTSQSLPNGTINLATIPSHHTMQTTSTVMSTAASSNSTSTHLTPHQQHQQQTIVIKNQGTNQNIVGNSNFSNNSIQLVNMRPPTPTAQAQPKTVATVSPRVVLSSPHMVASRPTNSAITLNALPTGHAGSALLLKTENGQYRLLTVGTAAQPTQPTLPNSAANQTIRIQTVPSVQSNVSSAGNTIVVNSSHVTSVMNSVAAMPPIASVAPVTHTMSQQQHQQTPQPQIIVSGNQQQTINASVNATPTNQTNLQNTKEKCRKFLANLLELSSREPKPVAQNVCTLIQELIDAKVEPDEFCDRLERLLNASPQPCLIGFLKKSLPLLRQSLFTKELTIDGINPPPQNVAFSQAFAGNIQAQVRPMVPTLANIGGTTQVRMIAQPRPTTITRHVAPVRIQGPLNAVPRLANATVSQIRTPSGATILQQHPANVQIHSNPPALHPVSQNAFTAPGGAQIRASSAQIGRSVTVRQTTPATIKQATSKAAAAAAVAAAHIPSQTAIKVGSTQIKPIINSSNVTANMSPAIVVANNAANNLTSQTTITSTTPAHVAIATAPAKPTSTKAQPTSSAAASMAKASAANKEKERKASASFYQQSSMSSSMYGDDDINDVAAMGGVNLAEESQRILGSTELIGRQIRSCKDEVFLHMPTLQTKIRNIIARHGLDEPNNEVAVLVSHACQERLKNIIEKLAVIAEHRIDIIKIDPRYEVTKDVRAQIKFLEELDKVEQKRHEEQEREMLMRAAKSRSKTEDPEQAKLKAKAKEMQRAEMEELRQRDANLTALQAIGPRKKPKLDGDAATTGTGVGSGFASGATGTAPLRPRIKRVNLRDMIFYMEQERETSRSPMLYKAYLK